MARPINATLFVNSFSPTVTPGEYTFGPSPFNNQTDATGNGAADVVLGGVLYVPAADVNTGFLVPGVVHRYRITQFNAVDTQTLSGTIIWDEKASGEIDQPANGVYCLYSESTPNQHFGLPPSDSVYPELSAGSSLASTLLDVRDITDALAGGVPPTFYLSGFTSGSAPITLTPKSYPPVLINNSSAVYKISVIGRRIDAASQGCAFQFTGLVDRNSNSATTILIGPPQKTILGRSNTEWNATVVADTVNGGLSVQVAGSDATQIEWTASVDLVKSLTF